MKILAVDASSVCRNFWELYQSGRLTDGEAFTASMNRINQAAAGFDRVALALDVGPSFRKLHCPEYKAKRPDPGEAYRRLVRDVVERLVKDGATVFPNKGEVGKIVVDKDEDGAPLNASFYPEADDVIASLAAWYCQRRGQAENAMEDLSAYHLRILSGDTDLWALVADSAHIDVEQVNGERKVITEKDVAERFGGVGSWVTELKALAGDDGDEYRPFRHPEPPADGKKEGPGIGKNTAIELLKQWGSWGKVSGSPARRVYRAAVLGAQGDESAMADGHPRRCLVAARGGGLDVGYPCARMLTDLPLDFSRILAEPKVQELTVEKPLDAVEKPVTTELVVSSKGGIAMTPRGHGRIIRQHALQPRSPSEAIEVAKEIFNSRMFPQYPNWQAVFVSIVLGNEQGVPMATALDQGYVVHGRLARSAAYLVGLVKKSGKCRELTVTRVTDKECTGAYRSTDDRVGPHGEDVLKCPSPKAGKCDCLHVWTFTYAMADKAGWTKSKPGNADKKWVSEPQTMLPWAWYRISCRRGWPEITGGVMTRAELLADPQAINDEAAELLDAEATP